MANQVGGNSTTENKMEPTTGMMVDTEAAHPLMTAVTTKNIWQPDKLPLTSTEPVMSPSLQLHALMLSLLLKSSETHLSQPPLPFLESLLLPLVLLPSATSPSKELRLHSSKPFMLEQLFEKIIYFMKSNLKHI